MLGRGAWRGVLLVGLVLVGAWAATGQLPRDDEDDAANSVLVGDLKLADDDEGPSDGVEATFVGRDLAPGDRVRGQLHLFRETPSGRSDPSLSELELRFDHEASPGGFAQALQVQRLAYGDRDLREDAAERCGEPLTLAALSECTRRSDNPLSGLEDPTPAGRPLHAVFALAPTAGSDLENAELDLTIEAELSGREPLDTDAREAGLEQSTNGLDCEVTSPGLEVDLTGSDLSGSQVASSLPAEAEAWLQTDLAQVC